MTPFASSRWPLWGAFFLSIAIWFGVTTLAADAVFTLVKSNFSFGRPFGSVSLTTILITLIWPLAANSWVTATTPVKIKNLTLGMASVTGLTVGSTLLTAWSTNQLWDFQWLMIAVQIIIWALEIVAATWVAQRATHSSTFRKTSRSTLVNGITALTWVTAAKSLLLCLSPGVVIRM